MSAAEVPRTRTLGRRYGGVMEQLKKLRFLRWDRTRFTMEPKLSEAVLRHFIDLHRKAWCTAASAW